MKITIIGSGSFGKALAHVLAKHEPKMADIENDGSYSDKSQKSIHEAELLIIAVPSTALKSCLRMIKPLLRDNVKIVSCVKALYYKPDLITPTMMIKRELGIEAAALTGANISEEIRADMPTMTILTGPKWVEKLLPLFKTKSFVAVTEEDTIGAEFGGAVKNAVSITSGLMEGTYGKNSSNTRGTTLALLMKELNTVYRRYSEDLGKARNIPRLSFIADTLATCTSEHSRNRTFGKQLGRKTKEKGVKEIYEKIGTVEGYDTVRALYEYVTDKNVHAPTIKALYRVLYRQEPTEILTEWLENADI